MTDPIRFMGFPILLVSAIKAEALLKQSGLRHENLSVWKKKGKPCQVIPSFSVMGARFAYEPVFRSQKKSPSSTMLEGLHPVFLTLFICSYNPYLPQSYSQFIRQVFWLSDLPIFCTFPSDFNQIVASCRFRPRSQRRDRSRF